VADEVDSTFWAEVEDAVELIHDQQIVEAILALRGVLKSSPKNPYAYHWLGVALFESSELEAARDAYRAALALSPQYLGARVHLSHVSRMLGDVRGALEQAELARRQAPDDPEVWHAMGLAYAQRGDREQATKWLELYLVKGSPEAEVQLEVRSILNKMGVHRLED